MNLVVSNGNKLRFKIEKFDYNKDEVFSEKTKIGNFEWSVGAVYKYESPSCYLTVSLICDAKNENKNWVLDLNGKIKLISHKSTKPSIRWDMRALYNTESTKNDAKICINDDLFCNEYWINYSIIVDVDFNFKLYDFSKNIPNFTDVIINVEDTEFHVNKMVLSSKSEYFYNLFVTNKCEDSKIELEDVKATDFSYMLSSFYKVSSANFDKNYSNLLDLARRFGVSSLHHSLEHFLISNKKLTVLEKLQSAEENEYEELLENCIESLGTQQKVRSVVDNEKFRELKESTKLRVMYRLLDCL